MVPLSIHKKTEGLTNEFYAEGKAFIFAMTFDEGIEIGETKEEIQEEMDEVFDSLKDTMEVLLSEVKKNTYKDATLVLKVYSSDKTLLYEKEMK